jgi:zinc protease
MEAQRLDPERVIAARLFRLAYSHHPYGSDVMGTPTSVLKMTRAMVQQYFADNYTPSNATLVIVGDVNSAALVPRVRAAFGVEMTPGNPLPLKLPPTDPLPKTERETMEREGRLGYYGVGFPAPSVGDPEVHATDVLVTLLEQGSYGRLPAALAGTAAGVKATFETRRQPGLLTIVVGAPPGALPKAESIVLGVVKDLAEKGPSDAEVLATKSVLAGSYAVDNETFAGQANSLGYYASIDRWQFATDYLSRVAAVTPAQVRAVAAKYLQPEHAVTLIVRPQAGAPPAGETERQLALRRKVVRR